MSYKIGATVALALICALCFFSTPVSAEPELTGGTRDIWEDIKGIRVTELKRSALACPLPVVGTACGEETPLYYFACCGELSSSCCFRLQDWVIAVLAVMAVLVILSIIINLIRCLCCY